MTNQQRNYKNSEDEIDLRQLFQAIGDFFNGIGKSIINTLVRIRRRSVDFKWLLLGSAIMGSVLGILYFNLSKPVYSSAMLLSSDYFNGRIVDNAIEKLNLLSEEEDKLGLANVLQIEQEVAQNIVEFEATPFVSEEDRVEMEVLKEKLSELDLDEAEIARIIDRIEIENKNTFQIIVRVNESGIIKGLEGAIVDYFRSNNYIKGRIANQGDRLLEELFDYKQEKEKLDSLKNAIIKAYESISKKAPNGSDNLYIGEQYSANPVDVFQQAERLNKLIRNTKESIFLRDDFELVDGLTVFRKPESANLIKTIFYSFWIGLGLGYAIIILITINQYLKRIESERFN